MPRDVCAWGSKKAPAMHDILGMSLPEIRHGQVVEVFFGPQHAHALLYVARNEGRSSKVQAARIPAAER